MKKLTKTIWYGSGVDMDGQPIVPRPANGADDLGGLHLGELFLHLSDKVTLWALSESGEVVCISGNEQEIDLTGYLLKSVWDSVFEIRKDSNGREFLFGKLPFATQYGITSYANVGNLNIPGIYDGLPIDWSTIYWEEVTNADGTKTRVLKARGGSGEGGDIVVEGITIEQVAAYLETNKYATQPWVEGKGYLTSITSAMVTGALGFTPFDAASFTKANIKSKLGIADWALASSKPSYTYSEISGLGDELAKYIPISGYTEILGEKNFTGGLKVNGCPIVYDSVNKYWKLEGDLLVTGGVTTHASNSTFKPSTIMDALLLDSTTLGINANGQLYVKGGGGGLTEVHWSDVIDRPTKLSQFTDDVVSGKYLPLSGGTLTGSGNDILVINRTDGWPYIRFKNNGEGLAYFGVNNSKEMVFIPQNSSEILKVLHTGNYSNYALPLSGGTVGVLYVGGTSVGTGHLATMSSKARISLISFNDGNNYIESGNSDFSANLPLKITGKQAGLGSDLYLYFNNIYCRGNNYINIDSGNYSSYALPYTGGRLSNSATGLYINRTTANTIPHITFESQGKAVGDIGVRFDGTTPVWYNYKTNTWNDIITSDNAANYNVGSATKLKTARTIWGQSFDGTKDISGVISGATAVYFAGGTTYYLGSTGNINCLGLTANGATTLKSTLGVTGAVTMESNLLVKGHVTSYSQRSLKNVIDERGLSLEELVTIKPTRYTWKDGRDELVHIGGIADDVQKVLPEVVFDNNGTLTMDYAMAGFAIAASLIKPVAKHEEDIESLKKRIKELEMEVERLNMN